MMQMSFYDERKQRVILDEDGCYNVTTLGLQENNEEDDIIFITTHGNPAGIHMRLRQGRNKAHLILRRGNHYKISEDIEVSRIKNGGLHKVVILESGETEWLILYKAESRVGLNEVVIIRDAEFNKVDLPEPLEKYKQEENGSEFWKWYSYFWSRG